MADRFNCIQQYVLNNTSSDIGKEVMDYVIDDIPKWQRNLHKYNIQLIRDIGEKFHPYFWNWTYMYNEVPIKLEYCNKCNKECYLHNVVGIHHGRSIKDLKYFINYPFDEHYSKFRPILLAIKSRAFKRCSNCDTAKMLEHFNGFATCEKCRVIRGERRIVNSIKKSIKSFMDEIEENGKNNILTFSEYKEHKYGRLSVAYVINKINIPRLYKKNKYTFNIDNLITEEFKVNGLKKIILIYKSSA